MMSSKVINRKIICINKHGAMAVALYQCSPKSECFGRAHGPLLARGAPGACVSHGLACSCQRWSKPECLESRELRWTNETLMSRPPAKIQYTTCHLGLWNLFWNRTQRTSFRTVGGGIGMIGSLQQCFVTGPTRLCATM